MASNNAPSLPVEKGNYDTTAPVFAQGLIALLQPVVVECDERIQAVMHSQRELSNQLDALSAELDRFMEVSKTPLIGGYIEKLLRAKERMTGINVLLGNIQSRLEALQRENSLPPSKLPPITIPSSQAQNDGAKKGILNVNQPQFLSSWISKAKAFVPETPTGAVKEPRKGEKGKQPEKHELPAETHEESDEREDSRNGQEKEVTEVKHEEVKAEEPHQQNEPKDEQAEEETHEQPKGDEVQKEEATSAPVDQGEGTEN